MVGIGNTYVISVDLHKKEWYFLAVIVEYFTMIKKEFDCI